MVMHDFVIENGVLKTYTGPGGDVVIPEGVTTIGEQAFFRREDLTSVHIPEGVRSIESEAFSGCMNLSSIQIPESVIDVGPWAFASCKGLRSITLPEGISSIKNKTFCYCSGLTSFTIPNSVTSIGNKAFCCCDSLDSITIPEGVAQVGDGAFVGCKNLTTVWLPQKDLTLGEGVFDNCTKLTSLIAPKIPFSAWKDQNTMMLAVLTYMSKSELYQVPEIVAEYRQYISRNVRKIRPLLFANDLAEGLSVLADLKKITAKNLEADFLQPAQEANATACVAFLLEWKNQNVSPKQMERQLMGALEKDPFNVADMKKLWSYVKLEDGTLEITGYKGTETEITVPERIGKASVTRIADKCFSTEKEGRRKTQCAMMAKLRSVTLPESITTVGQYAFYGCTSLTSVTIPMGADLMGYGIFYRCSHLTIHAPADSPAQQYAENHKIRFEKE